MGESLKLGTLNRFFQQAFFWYTFMDSDMR